MNNNNNKNPNNKNPNNKKPNNKKPTNPRLINKTKYFKIGARDSTRIRLIKEGMNHLFDERNNELEEAFLQEATQYTERVLGESRRFHLNEEEDHETMDVIFNNSIEEITGGTRDETEEVIEGKEEERLEREAEEESDTLDSEEVLALQERIEREDQEEYDRIRAELDEEEKANNDN